MPGQFPAANSPALPVPEVAPAYRNPGPQQLPSFGYNFIPGQHYPVPGYATAYQPQLQPPSFGGGPSAESQNSAVLTELRNMMQRVMTNTEELTTRVTDLEILRSSSSASRGSRQGDTQTETPLLHPTPRQPVPLPSQDARNYIRSNFGGNMDAPITSRTCQGFEPLSNTGVPRAGPIRQQRGGGGDPGDDPSDDDHGDGSPLGDRGRVPHHIPRQVRHSSGEAVSGSYSNDKQPRLKVTDIGYWDPNGTVREDDRLKPERLTVNLFTSRLKRLASRYSPEQVVQNLFAAMVHVSDWLETLSEDDNAELDTLDGWIRILHRDWGKPEVILRARAQEYSYKDSKSAMEFWTQKVSQLR